MSMALTKSNQILPGRVLYHVYGGNLRGDGNPVTNGDIAKYIVLTKPNSEGRFEYICVYNDYHGGKKEYKTGGYCTDNGIFDLKPGLQKYNLNRLFFCEDDALDFIIECVKGEFNDPTDKEAAERSARNKEDMLSWDF